MRRHRHIISSESRSFRIIKTLFGAVVLVILLLTFFANAIDVFLLSSHSRSSSWLRGGRRPLRYGHYVGGFGNITGIFDGDEATASGSTTDTSGQPPKETLAALNFRKDGLVEVDEDGPHPIYDLIARGEKAWKEKVERQSKTLEDAVVEYRRRYKRDPPMGFDRWWMYVQEHEIQLPDEYDTIFHDLEPFWGIKSKALRRIQKELELKKDSYTIGKDTKFSGFQVKTSAFKETSDKDALLRRSAFFLDLLHDIAHELPPVRATFNPHDNPNRLTDYAVYEVVLQAAALKQELEVEDLPEVTSRGWVNACPPLSPARNWTINLDEPPPSPGRKTFIHDHHASMDPCLHPEHFYHHGQFLYHELGPAPERAFVPEFSACSTTLHHNIRIPSLYGWEKTNGEVEWDNKTDERVDWRGRNTGMDPSPRWRQSHRHAMVAMANWVNGTRRLMRPTRTGREKVGEDVIILNSIINPAALDIAFAGDPVQCDEEVCDAVKKEYRWAEYQSDEEAWKYKYILDIDGNGWSGRFRRLISSKSMVFKATIYPEWFVDRIQPWVHYVPVQLDLSDLHDAYIFFHGDINGHNAHDELARKIAVTGRAWSEEYWRREDMVAYCYRYGLSSFDLTTYI